MMSRQKTTYIINVLANHNRLHVAKAACRWIFVSILMLMAVSCSMIDEDMSDCGEQAQVDYELRLITNMTTELKTQLTTTTDLNIAQALRTHLSDVFTDYAHDVDLSFYDTQGDSARLQHNEHFMDANQASYELNLPMRQYMHLATANILDNPIVTLEDDDNCHRAILQQIERDTVDSHTTGIFTARQPMQVIDGQSQNFNVHLYMANCSAVLVIDPRGHDVDDIKVFATGFATGFKLCDSTYVFPEKCPIMRTQRLEQEESDGKLAFCVVSFPSREVEPSATRTVIETEDPFVSPTSEESLWEFHVYVPEKNGASTRAGETYTQSIIGIRQSQRAGEVKVVKVHMGEDGTIESESPEVGVSVTLNWQPGGTYNPEI